MTPVIDRAGVEKTLRLIRPHVRRTPCVELDGTTLKLEFMQHAGSFKARGAFANLLMRPVPEAGVTAASGGNHGAAVAYAARELGVRAGIFVPRISSPAKTERIRGYGAELVVEGADYSEALSACEAWTKSSGALPVHAYDQRETLLGQGTLALELEEQTGGIDTVLVAVGGGGLIAGIAAALAGKVRVIGVEPESCPCLMRAMEAGGPVDAPVGGIAADSLGARRVGALVYPLVRDLVARVVPVSDEDIKNAQRQLWSRMRIVAEPGGAAAFAALSAGHYVPERGERVAVVVSGANTIAVDFDIQERK